MICNPVNAINPLTRRNFHGLNLVVFSCQQKEYEMEKTSKMSGWFKRNFFPRALPRQIFELSTRQINTRTDFQVRDGNEGMDGWKALC